MKVKKLASAVRSITIALDLSGKSSEENYDSEPELEEVVRETETVVVRYRLGALNTGFGRWLEQNGDSRNSLADSLVKILVDWELEVDEDLFYQPPMRLEIPVEVKLSPRTSTSRAVREPKEIQDPPLLVAKAGSQLPVTPEAIEAAEVPTAFLRLVLTKVFEDATPGKLSSPASVVS